MMRTLRRILAIARKELLVLMGTRQSRFMVLIPPIIQIFIFAWAATMEVKNVDVVVINEDSGYWSQEVISRLRGSPTFRHITFEDDFKKAEEAINRQDVLVVMHFQNDFSAKVERGVPAEVQLLLDGRRSNTAQILTQYVQQIVQGLATATPAFVQAKPSRVEVEALNWFNPNLDFRWFILPNLIGTINFLMGMIITGLTVAREREHVRPDARLAREPGGDRLREADPRLCGRACARDHLLFLHNRVLRCAVCGVCGGAVRDHAAVLAFGEQHRAYGVLVRLHAAAGFFGVLYRGRAVHPAFGIHDAREQHADVLTGSEPTEPAEAFYRDPSGAVPQGHHHERGAGQQRADRRDHGGIHAVRDLDVYAQGLGPRHSPF